MEGEECGLEHVSVCAKETTGSVHTLDPMEMDRQLRAITQKAIVATNVDVKVYTRGDLISLQQQATTWTLAVGVVTSDTDLAIPFAVHPRAYNTSVEAVPFQVSTDRLNRKSPTHPAL